MKLWNKENTSTSQRIEKFTVGRDKDFDLLLAPYDVKGSIAHVKMLGAAGIMPSDMAELAVRELETILAEIEAGNFEIGPDVEDIHSQVEFMLTQRIGEAGKMIHSGRSRNDQVAVDIKLYLKDELNGLKNQVSELFDLLIGLSEQHKEKLLPGYTHLQMAMPSSFGLWFGAYAESLVDDMELVYAAYNVVNKNPLGSGAGYGSSFPLKRQMTTDLLGFSQMNVNSVYAQMTRGKAEKFTGIAISGLAATLARLSMDCCLYLNQHFGFISFPAELTTGSSIMPHKKNPDVFELIRARCNRLQAVPNEFALLLTNLPSGYHRDLQLTKEIIFPALETLKDCLSMMLLMMEQISVADHILEDEKYRYLFSVEAVNALVNKGVPFREAYKQVGDSIEAGNFQFGTGDQLLHTHEGSIHNLRNDLIKNSMQEIMQRFK